MSYLLTLIWMFGFWEDACGIISKMYDYIITGSSWTQLDTLPQQSWYQLWRIAYSNSRRCRVSLPIWGKINMFTCCFINIVFLWRNNLFEIEGFSWSTNSQLIFRLSIVWIPLKYEASFSFGQSHGVLLIGMRHERSHNSYLCYRVFKQIKLS